MYESGSLNLAYHPYTVPAIEASATAPHPFQPGFGSGFWPNLDPGLCTSDGGRFFKFNRINILANLKSRLFCFHILGVRRPLKALESRIRISPDPVWFSGSRISM